MSGPDPSIDRIYDLAGAICDDVATREDMAEIDAMMSVDPDLRQDYVDYCKVHVALRLEMLADRATQRVHEQIAMESASCAPLVERKEDMAPIAPGLFAPIRTNLANLYASDWPVAYFAATIIVGIGMIIGALTYKSHPVSIAYHPSPQASPTTGVATITAVVNCIWERKGLGITDWELEEREEGGEGRGKVQGSRFKVQGKKIDRFQNSNPQSLIPNPSLATNHHPLTTHPKSLICLGDQFVLSSGLMEITYNTGARVILQGPCTYEVDSAAGGFLSIGKLTARVEQSTKYGVRSTERVASESRNPQIPKSLNPSSSPQPLAPSPLFTVRTPTAAITDLGTEFGVEVDAAGGVETQVFEGEVAVAAIDPSGRPGTTHRVVQGNAVFVSKHGVVSESRIEKTERFTRTMPSPGVIRDDFNSSHNYLQNGTEGTIWDGLLNANNALWIDTLPTEDVQSGLGGQSLVIAVPKDANVGWSEPHRGATFKNAPFIYIDAPAGDFDARVQISNITTEEYSVAGLMARRDDDNFVSVNRNQFPGGLQFATRSELSGVDSDYQAGISEGRLALRLVRMGETFLASCSTDGGETWTPMLWANGSTAMRRPDMTGPVQIGLWYGTFTTAGGSARFDNFTLRHFGKR